MAARTEIRRAPGGRGGRKDPNGLTLGGLLGLVSAVWTSLTLNESAQSRITACIPSPSPPPPPPQRQTKSGGLRGERRPSSLHKRCYCYHFFFCRRGTLGAGGCPKPRYLGNSSKTEIRPKNFPESTCCRNEDFRETPMRCARSLCSRTSSLHYQNTFEAPVLFWDEQSDIFGKASVSSLRRSRTGISRDFV